MNIEFDDKELEIKNRKISDDELVVFAKELISLKRNETELEKLADEMLR